MKKIIFGILILVIWGNVLPVSAATLNYCSTLVGNGTVCRGSTTTSETSSSATLLRPARAGGILGCLKATKYNVIQNSGGATVSGAYWSTCNDCDVDNGFTRTYVSNLPMIKTPATSITGEGTPYTNEITYTGYVCCGNVRTTSSEDILSPNGYYGYVGARVKTTSLPAYTLTTGVCTTGTSSIKYNCSCVDGFVSDQDADSFSKCNCVLDSDSGYVCHATECSRTAAKGAYISDDGLTCESCPSFTNMAGLVQYGRTSGTASSVHGCSIPEAILQNDGTGVYGHSAACNYN